MSTRSLDLLRCGCIFCKRADPFDTCDEPHDDHITLHRNNAVVSEYVYVKTFENATSLLLAVAAQALAIGVILAI